MKRFIVLIFLLNLLHSCSQTQKETLNTLWELEKFKGDVSLVVDLDKNGKSTAFSFYNEDGICASYSLGEEWTFLTIYHYDQSKIKEKWDFSFYKDMADAMTTSKISFLLNKDGRPEFAKKEDDDYKAYLKYNGLGQLVYDSVIENGRPTVNKYFYDFGGKLKQKHTLINFLDINYYYLLRTSKNREEQRFYRINDSLKSMEHVYTDVYTINDNGDYSGWETTYEEEKNTFSSSCDYTYDKMGNWTEKRVYSDGELKSTYRRLIFYKEDVISKYISELKIFLEKRKTPFSVFEESGHIRIEKNKP